MKTKKITRKGCRNVQLVWNEENELWVVQKIDPTKPAIFVTKREMIEYPTLRTFKKTVTRFPFSNPREI